MLYTALHNRWFRILTIFLGETIVCAALRLFIVPQGLYSGGMTGLSQLLRTAMETLLQQPIDPMKLIYPEEVPLFDKYDEYIPVPLLQKHRG